MSGIVGVLNTDGAPVSHDLLSNLTAFLRFRGPDVQNCWCDSEVGFGHALLDTTGGSVTDNQPLSIGGNLWIVADARIDAQGELRKELQSAGGSVPSGVSAAELILFAYKAWGADCVHHLLGDFAFAIWDSARRRLFCARDHFGVKPFYYSNPPGSFVFSNTLNCVRLHPNVASQLNDLAICDYLLFGSNQDNFTTSFEEIKRLPPGHCLMCSGGEVSISRYWKLPQPAELHYRQRRDYIDNFRSLLGMAVQDRLPPGPVAICMSGGLDSSAVAAVACSVVGDKRESWLQPYSVVYERLIPDQERRFAGLVADFCGIQLHYLVADEYQLFQHWDGGDWAPAEPCDAPLLAINRDLDRQIAGQTRVTLTGQGGDPGLVPSADAILGLLKAGKVWNIAAGYARCALWQQCIPRVGLRTLLRGRSKNNEASALPEWLNPDLASKLDLSRRMNEQAHDSTVIEHPRAKAYDVLNNVWWGNAFELYDPGNSGGTVEARHPFFDVRLATFLLSLPTLPWCVGKQIIREAMIGLLPREVLRRRKAPLAGDPVVELLSQPQSDWVDSFRPTSELPHYVATPRIPALGARRNSSADAWLHLRPLSLNHWLRTQATLAYKGPVAGREESYGGADRAAGEKKYETPKLVRFGDLTEVTRATGTTTQKNDGAHSSFKTG